MRFFTRDFVAGELADAEVDSISAAYQRHIDAIIIAAPKAIAELARINLHDGLIRRVVVSRNAKELTLSLRCGDLQAGYFDLDIHYSGVSLDAQQLDALLRRERDRQTEILADEIDTTPDGEFVHRIIFWPEDELEIVFSSLTISRRARTDRAVGCDEGEYDVNRGSWRKVHNALHQPR